MSKTIKFEIVTPERLLLSEEISQIIVPTKAGEITVLPDHIPLVSVLAPGVIEIVKANGENEIMSVSGGFIEVLKDKIVILADSADRAEELELDKIEEAKRRAKELKEQARHADARQFADANAHIERELAREKALKRWRKLKNL